MKKLLAFILILLTVAVIVSCNEAGGGETSSSTPTVNEPTHEHSFGEWSISKEATCAEAGVEKRTCECGESEERELAKLPHTYTDTVTAPTCTSEGYTLHECACGDSYTDAVTEKLPHTYKATVTPPTQMEGGYTTYTCECGASYRDNFTSPLPDSDGSIRIVENGNATLRVVLPKDASMAAVYAKDLFIREIEKLTGVTLVFGYADEVECKYELLLGNTGRDESSSAASSLSKDQFAVVTKGNKIVVVADDDVLLYEAVRYLIDNCWTGSAVTKDEKNFKLNASVNEVKKGDVDSLYYILLSGSGNLSCGSTAFCELDNSKYYKPGQSYNNHIYRRQGGCLTEKAMYQAFISASQETAVVARKDLNTGDIIYSDPMPMGHANDMTYNPNTNEVYVGASDHVYIYDADTLEYKGKQAVEISASRIAYSADYDMFVIGSYKFFDTSFKNTGRSFSKSKYEMYLGGDTTTATLTSQGTTCDDTFIYALICKGIGNYKYYTYVAVYDWYGNFIRFITVKIVENFEPENISVINGEIYIGATSTQPVVTQYKLDLSSIKAEEGSGNQGSGNQSGGSQGSGDQSTTNALVEAIYTVNNKYASMDSKPRVHRRRGSFFDGESYYQAYLSADGSLGVIAKLNLKTGEVTYSEPLGIGDPKDVTLDKSGRLVLTTKSGAVHLFDAETLEHIGGKGLDCAPTTLTFNERLGGYYAIMGGQLFVIDSDFNMLGVGRSFSVADNYVAHAMSSDKEGNNYVLCVKGVGSEQYVGRIVKYDKDMKQVLLTVDFALPNNYEPTGLSMVNGEMYVSGCSAQPVTTLYKITVKQ